MLRRIAIAVTFFVTATGTWAVCQAQSGQTTKEQTLTAQTPASTAKIPKSKSHKAPKKKPAAQKQVMQEAPPPPPPPPPTLEQQAAVAPEISYRGGLLTITARNSTMNDVLTGVRRVTGANIERPPASGSERVVGIFGPGQPKDVLTDLLNGSRYDYIILGSTTRPGGIDRVVLTARSNAAPPTAVANNNQAPQNNQPAAEQEEPDTEPDTDTEDQTAPERDQEAPAEQQATPAENQNQQPGQPQPGQQPGQVQPDQNQQQNQNQQNQQQNQVKSPEELLRELQQMQQQQQQQQQQNQQNPPNENPPEE